MKDTTISSTDAVKMARHVTWVGFWINAVLGVAKVLGGIFGKSSALIADGVHSFSDFLSDIIVIVMVGVSRKRPDEDHPFGHGRYEALATLMLAVMLLIVAAGILWEGIDKIIAVAHGEILPRPGMVALIILVVSIAAKEWLYHYTRRTGIKIKSEAVVANAWHHRSDAFSSIATLAGVAGAMFLGEKWRVLDPVAAVVVAVFIAIVGVKMAQPALDEMLGKSLPEKDIEALENAMRDTDGVLAWHRLRTFKSGNDAYIEVHLKLDPNMSVMDAHAIATTAEKNMAASIPEYDAHITTHIEPYLKKD